MAVGPFATIVVRTGSTINTSGKEYIRIRRQLTRPISVLRIDGWSHPIRWSTNMGSWVSRLGGGIYRVCISLWRIANDVLDRLLVCRVVPASHRQCASDSAMLRLLLSEPLSCIGYLESGRSAVVLECGLESVPRGRDIAMGCTHSRTLRASVCWIYPSQKRGRCR